MITILLVNLVGVTIYVAGIGVCLRATKRTGNQGYLLLAAYLAAVLAVSSLEQVKRMQAGPISGEDAVLGVPEPQVDGSVAEAPQGSGDSSVLADGLKDAQVATESPWESVAPPILPALLLAGVFVVARDDPRRARETAEAVADASGKAVLPEGESEAGKGSQA